MLGIPDLGSRGVVAFGVGETGMCHCFSTCLALLRGRILDVEALGEELARVLLLRCSAAVRKLCVETMRF